MVLPLTLPLCRRGGGNVGSVLSVGGGTAAVAPWLQLLLQPLSLLLFVPCPRGEGLALLFI